MNQLVPLAQAGVMAPRSIATGISDLPFGSQAAVCTADGRIDAFLAYVSYERFNSTAKYALRVLNNSAVPARARLYCIRRDGSKLSAYPRDFEIAPFAMRDDMIPVRVDVTGHYERALVEISSVQTYFTVEAPAPPRPKPQWLRWVAVAAAPVVLMGATELCVPRILGVEVPSKALAGSKVDVPLQVSGVGTIAYDFSTRDGVQLAAGLVERSSVIRLSVPDRGAGAPYALHVRMRNAFGSAQAASTIAAIVPATPRPKAAAAAPQIAEVSVHPSTVQAGQKIMVQYATNVRTGDVWLVDMNGRTWAAGPLTSAGATTLNVPGSAAGREMRVVVHAQSGKQHAQSAVGVTVLPQVVAAAPPPDPAADKPQVAQPQILLSSPVVSPGDSVTVRVSGMQGDVRVTLMSESGATLEQGETSQDDGGVSITAPSVSAVTAFYVVASFSDGTAEQSIVHRLMVTPR